MKRVYNMLLTLLSLIKLPSIKKARLTKKAIVDNNTPSLKTDKGVLPEYYRAKVIATPEQLDEIGIDLSIDGQDIYTILFYVPTCDLDKWVGVDAPCSTIVYKHVGIAGSFDEEYVISTKWLEFK
jgi:hypothetical protein